MYFEIPNMLTPLLTNFTVAVFASNHAYTLLSRYEYFYIAIMIVNFISIYQYIGISRTSLTHSAVHSDASKVPLKSNVTLHVSNTSWCKQWKNDDYREVIVLISLMIVQTQDKYCKYVTWSDKTDLIAHYRMSNFLTNTKLCESPIRFQCHCNNRSASAGCFFLALWRSIQAVWGLHGAMSGQQWNVCACQVSWWWIKTCGVD